MEHGAVLPETAKTLTELGLDRKSGMFELMVLKKHIMETDGKYYLDADGFNDRIVKKLHDFVVDLFEDATSDSE